ncbi:acylphosphatase [Sphingomonas sp. HDW15A]|uniref:acylphosphatase n=1 Tax=Sphingomonas sp. HDW15A TaxID=2714942 RepID=UPI0019D2A8E2|nr:acylphosphatase [Sphingomonas sp. HDW15A]
MATARRIRVTGRVQGVFFRAWTREQAKRLGVFGWVRNCADGSVEAHVEGEQAAVEEMIAAMKHGPGAARVDALDCEAVALTGAHNFEVTH